MKMKYRFASILAIGFAIAAWGQQSAPPPAAPANSGPTLAATMQFIQEKLSEQGKVGYAITIDNQPGVTYRLIVNVADVMADPAACTLYTTETIDKIIELPPGKSLKPGGPVTADDLHTHTLETDAISLKQVEKITVEKMQDINQQANVEAGYPEVKVTVAPLVFFVKLSASTAVFSGHSSTTKGNQAPVEKDVTEKKGGITIRDEETANKVAKAMTHAMELCGGGVKKELF